MLRVPLYILFSCLTSGQIQPFHLLTLRHRDNRPHIVLTRRKQPVSGNPGIVYSSADGCCRSYGFHTVHRTGTMSASASPGLQPLEFGHHHRAASQSIIDSTRTLNDLKKMLRKEKDESGKKMGKPNRLLQNERMALFKQQEQARKMQESVALAAAQVEVQRERLGLKERQRAYSKSAPVDSSYGGSV